MNSSLAAPVLGITDLAKTLPGGRQLFAKLNLVVEPGEVVAIMGESGVGKSTLLNLIAGLDESDQGQILLCGNDMAGQEDDALAALRRDRIGFVFQAFHLLPHLTLGRNVALPSVLARQRSRVALARAAELLAAVGLAGRDGHYPYQLSGGELQRVAIARALINGPALILADEPTGNLDRGNGDRILEFIRNQARDTGVAVLMVTHSERAAVIANRTLVLSSSGLTQRNAA